MESCVLLGGGSVPRHGGHSPLYMYRVLVHGIDEVFKFTFVRNPWDRAVSAFFHHQKQWNRDAFVDSMALVELLGDPGQGTFPSLLKWPPPHHYLPQWFFICDADRNIGVDFVGRYENLQKDWEEVCMRVVGEAVSLSHHRPGAHEDYRQYYDTETREAVRAAYGRDIELFGYEFE